MTRSLNSFFSWLLGSERKAREIHPMRRRGGRRMSTYHQTLGLHITSTTQSAGRGLAR
jgi:hypothetical protein